MVFSIGLGEIRFSPELVVVFHVAFDTGLLWDEPEGFSDVEGHHLAVGDTLFNSAKR